MSHNPNPAHRPPNPGLRFHSSVVLKQTSLAALLIVLTSGTLIGSGYWFVRKIITEQIDQRLVLAASDRQVLLQTYMKQQLERAGLVASRTRLRQLVADYGAGKMASEEFRSESRRILLDAQRSSEGFLVISVTDLTGKVSTSTKEEELGTDYSVDPGFLEGRRERAMGLPRLIAGNYQAFLMAPVATDDHRLLGVAVISLDIGPMVKFLTSATGLGASGEVLVGTHAGDTLRLLFPTRHQPTHEVGFEGGTAMAEAIRGKTGFVQTRDYRNVEVLAAYRPVGYRDWGLVAKIDVREAYAPLTRLNTFILALVAGILLCGLIASYVLAGKFTQPLLELSVKATAIASGDLAVRARIRSGDELGHLARAFNEMAESLQRKDDQRGQAERDLRISEEKFSKAFDASPDAVLITRLQDGCFVEVNPSAEKLFGYSRAELIGKTALSLGLFADPADRERTVGLMKQQGFLRNYEGKMRNRAGEDLHVLVSLDEIQIANSPHLLAIVRDITALKRAEEDRSAKDAAEAANRAKSEFLSRMSHELRTPLNAIIGFGQLMEMDAATPEQLESVDQILKAGRHLLNLINEILDIARIEAGRLSLSIEPVVLQEIVEECQDLIRPSAAQRRIVLDLQTALDNQIVMADRQRLKQVLLNLLSNAVKFNTESGRVTLSCMSPSHDRLRISVTDTGSGISPESLPKLFTPFERLGAGQMGIEGTGLGLALSKTLTEAMDGVMGVESTVGRGSTFWIELPVALNVAPEADAREPAAAAVGLAPNARAARTVLYIEDNLSNLKLLERVMARRPDVWLLTAMQGRLGLDLARQHHPDLILLDLDLPDVRGDQVLRTLRNDAATGDIPVVILTATATPREIDRLLNSGARAYLTKPFDVKALFSLLDEIVAA